MREALARSDHDFVLAAPRKPVRAQRRDAGMISSFFRALLRHPGRMFIAVVFMGLFVGIAINALYLQTARHPAPIFSGPVIARPAAPIPAPRPAETVAAKPTPAVPATAMRDAPVQMRDAAMPVREAAAPMREAAAPKGDAIGALLSSGAIPSAQVQSSEPNARALAAQKALVKLGYAVKADGVMGGSTRKAIETFEQSRKLPVTGDLTPRTLRELSALSGIAVP